MSYYRICPTCGAHLDPGERCCDCNLPPTAQAIRKAAGANRMTLGASIAPLARREASSYTAPDAMCRT